MHVFEPLVRLAQVLVRGHGVLRDLERVRYVQHVVAEQLVHAGQGLRGLRAVQQHLRFLAADTQLGAEAVGKHGVLVRERHAGSFVFRLQLALIQGVLQQRHEPVHVHLAGKDAVERFHLRFLLLSRIEAVDCGERERLLPGAVGQRDNAGCRSGAQVLAADLAGGRVLAAAPRTADIGHAAAPLVTAGFLLGGGVEPQLARRD